MKVDVFPARQAKPARKYNRRSIRYGIGVAREGFRLSGIVNIKRKAEWPTWRRPADMIARERKNGRRLPAVMKGGAKKPAGGTCAVSFPGQQRHALPNSWHQ